MMRKILGRAGMLFMLSLLLSFGIISCMKERIIYIDSDGNVVEKPQLASDEGILNVSLSNTGVNSRVARPVGSSAANNNVNVVKIYAFSKQISTAAEGEGDTGQGDSNTGGESKNTDLIALYPQVEGYAFDPNVEAKSETTSSGLNISGAEGVIYLVNFVNKDAGGDIVGDHQPDVDLESHTDQSCTVTLKGLRDGYVYKFVAVGYNADLSGYEGDVTKLSENPYGVLSGMWNNSVGGGDTGGTTYSRTTDSETGDEEEYYNVGIFEKKFTTKTSKTGFKVEELFSGESDEIYPATLGSNSLILTRQVAGMLGYFTNVPTKVGSNVVRFLRVYASQTYNYFSFPANGSDLNGYGGSGDGSVSNPTKQLLLSFDMQAIATNYKAEATEQMYTKYTFYSGGDGNGFVSSEDSNSGPVDESNSVYSDGTPPLASNYVAPIGLKLARNSIFGGRFVIPYQTKDANDITITVVLQDSDGEILKMYYVYSTATDDGVSGDSASGTVGNNYLYNILCNNFYSLGVKKTTEDNTGDKPIDLATGADIEVVINDAWDVLHQMGVEEVK